ncbi:MAG: SDR family NAD(P)-dependent oxidoreductase [Alphaproteobacteria bacterium]
MSDRFKGRTVVVTGVSTGIGHATAERLLRDGFRVFGSVRKPGDAERLSKQLGAGFSPLLFDVTDEAAIAAAAAEVKAALGDAPLFGLVNNAGMPAGGPLMHQPVGELLEVLRVNAVAVVAVTQAFLPLLGARRDFAGQPGRIVNISSVGGRLVVPFIGAYQASKHALEALSDALRRELMIYGIDVVTIEPGSVVTPIWDKAERIGFARYAGTDYAGVLERFGKMVAETGRAGLPPSRVAEIVHVALTTPRPRARYAVVRNRLVNWDLPRAMPDRWLDRAMAKRIGLKRLRKG